MLKPVFWQTGFRLLKIGFQFLLTFIKIYYIRQIILCITHCNIRTRKAVSTLMCSFSRFSLNEAMNIHCVRMKSSTQQKVSQLIENCKYLPEILNSTTVTICTRDPKAVWKYS